MKYQNTKYRNIWHDAPNDAYRDGYEETFGQDRQMQFCPKCDLKPAWCECPKIIPAPSKIQDEIRQFMSINLSGCCLHIALEDENLDTDSVVWCVDHAIEQGHPECEQLARKLLAMTEVERWDAHDAVLGKCCRDQYGPEAKTE